MLPEASKIVPCSARGLLADRPATGDHDGMTQLAFLGTGLIGGSLAEAAAKRGDTVSAWNRTRSKAESLAVHGVRVAATAGEAIWGAERIHLALPDDKVIDQVLDACGPALAGQVVVDHSTTSPAATARRAARLEARGVAYLHAPVFMSPAMCRSAAGLMLAAGPRALFERVAPALQKMTGAVEYLGEERGRAAAFKLFGNAMILTVVGGLADVYAIAKAQGISAADAHGLFSKFNPAATIGYRGAAMAKGDYRASFELAMARKDAGLMIEAAGGEVLAVLPAIARRMEELIAAGHGADDLAVLSVGSIPKKS
jgi:3-hydroxyisobutyrate dehydrogenase-like beta-hydroxyacid dehydrogenase